MIDNDTQLHRRRLIFKSYGDSWTPRPKPIQVWTMNGWRRPYLLKIQEGQQEVLIDLSANPTAADA